MIQKARAVSDGCSWPMGTCCVQEISRFDSPRFPPLPPFLFSDESFNPGEEDDEIAEE